MRGTHALFPCSAYKCIKLPNTVPQWFTQARGGVSRSSHSILSLPLVHDQNAWLAKTSNDFRLFFEVKMGSGMLLPGAAVIHRNALTSVGQLHDLLLHPPCRS